MQHIINSQKPVEGLYTPEIIYYECGWCCEEGRERWKTKCTIMSKAPECNSAEMYYFYLCHTVPLTC